ncbi:MAG: hypothetical protein H7296_02685 [Bacteroidia bacterium]|nr:hypothetical protein [Bacteroidia bacterium]
MKDYQKIKELCQLSSKISAIVVDEFLMNYVADKEKLVSPMMTSIGKHKNVTNEIGQEYVNRIMAEFLVHKIFKEGGYIGKYLKQTAIKSLPEAQLQYLEFQHEHPWRFSYSVILNEPAPDFYKMQDVFSGEEYLLYSPGTTQTFKTQKPILWFNLIGFNGECWQTYGLITGFNGFTEDDIFFFATELNPEIQDEQDLLEELEQNPIPFILLLAGANYPLITSKHKGLAIAHWAAMDEIGELDTQQYKNNFHIAWNKDVYHLKLKDWCENPHFASAFYDEKQKTLFRYALTENGFEALTKAFGHLNLSPEADTHVVLSMVMTTEKILNRKIIINPYENFFEKTVSEKEQKSTDLMNKFIQLALPYFNEGKEPDLEALAKQAGIDIVNARSLWEFLNKQMKESR